MKRGLILGLTILLATGFYMMATGAEDEGSQPSGTDKMDSNSGMGPGMVDSGMGPGMHGGMMDSGMGPGMGPGMVGRHGGMMGMGMMRHGMMSPGMMRMMAELPEEKAKQLHDVHFSMMRLMAVKMGEMQKATSAMKNAMHAFPIDREAAMAQWRTASQLRGEIFQSHLGMMAEAQQIVGQENWDKMHQTRQHKKHRHGSAMME
ncbi:MAG: periplasmic heavy metal sensor [SAR324 cluster bacterium]|nr:periplasmic heavy metal sensor [SAR324 cluster bacterium]